ncbi:tetratricopeptide repeat protein [Candidatus Sumerlaeota bacterium]|nr:tetratricopeptide repeat protein [Candidatus Sumerlaeota bacterium]
MSAFEKPVPQSIRKLVILCGASVLIVGWAFYQWRGAQAIAAQNEEVFSLSSADLLEVDTQSIPNRANAYVKMAALVGTRKIPPDHKGAVEYLGKALAIEPLRSDIWLRLTRHFLFLRDREKARAALSRSDQLDPVYPEQRMEAAQLWAMLGDRERAVAVLGRISALDALTRKESIRTYHLLSVPSDEIFTDIGGEKLSMAEVQDLLPQIKSADADSMKRLWAKIPAKYREDRDFANMAARLYSTPLIYPIVEEIWRKRSTDFVEIVVNGAPPILAENAGMTKDPLNGDFYFGWQEFPRTNWVRAEWVEGPTEGRNGASVRMTFSGSGVPTMQRDFEWVFYRLPLQPTAVPLAVSIDVLPSPATDSICRIGARINGRGFGSPQTKWNEQGWQTVTVVVPPAEEARVLDLAFQRNRRGTGADAASKVFMSGFRVEEAPQTDKEAAP